MASDPNQLLSALLGTGGITGSSFTQGLANAQQQQMAPLQVQGAQQGLQQGQQNLQLGQQQQTLNDQQITANQSAVDQQAQYAKDVTDWTANGADAGGLSALIAKYPKQYQALQDSWKVKDTAASQADLRTYGSIFNALDNGSTDVALKELQSRQQAEKAAGIDTTDLDQHIQQIQSGDKTAINAVKGWARAQIAAANPDAAKAVGVDLDSDRYKVISGKGVFDTRSGQYVDDPEGGDPASDGSGGVGSASGGRRSNGWTPSTADGGDNAPAVVTAKIATLAHTLGVDPNAPLTLDQAKSLSKAIAPTEGGPGSIADQNNNPTNIMDGKFARSQPGYLGTGKGGYAQFDSKASGDAAAQQLLAHYYARGQRTITDIIAGKPSGSPTGANAAAPSQTKLVGNYGKPPAGYRWVQGGTLEPIPGGPKDASSGGGYDSATISTMADQYLAGDTGVLQNLGRGASGALAVKQLRTAIVQQAKTQGLNGAQIAGRIADFKGVLSIERAVGTRTAQVELPAAEAQSLIPLALKASDALPRNGFLPFSRAEQSIRNGVNNPQLRQFVAANNALVNVYSRAVSPSGVPTDSDKSHARELLDTAYDNPSYHAVVSQMQKEIAAARTAPQQVRGQIQASVGSTGSMPSAGPTRTARGPNGQRIGLVGGRWVPIH